MCYSEWQYSKDFEDDSLCESILIVDVDAFEPKTDSFKLDKKSKLEFKLIQSLF